MTNKFLTLFFMITATPVFAASGAFEQLENNAGYTPRTVQAAVAPAASAPEEVSFKAVNLPRPGAAEKTYSEAVAEFNAYRESKRGGIKNEANLPFLLDHGARTGRTVLLIHGLSDSPWILRSLGEKFFQQGYNVVSILLPGHGTRPEDLLRVKELHWQQEVDRGLAMAAGLGERVSLAGFSTGGTLALDALRRHPELKAEDIFLFSPALALNEDYQNRIALTCQSPWLATQLGGEYAQSKPETIVEDAPYHYKKMAINGICQLYYLIRDVQRGQARIRQSLASGTRVFAVQSGADDIVSPAAVTKFMASLRGESNEYVFYPAGEGIDHVTVPRPEKNPRFQELLLRLQDFTAESAPGRISREYAPNLR